MEVSEEYIKPHSEKKTVIYHVGDVIVYEQYVKGEMPPKMFIATSVDMDFGTVGYDCDGIKDTIGGILETASLLTSTFGGVLGGALIGAGVAGKKLLETSIFSSLWALTIK